MLLLAAVGGTASIGTPEPDGATRSTPAPAPTGAETSYSLAWADEFDGPAGDPADPQRWTHDVGGSGWGNEQLEYTTEGTHNVALDGQGHLAITARRDDGSGHDCWYGPCRYTSGRITTAGKATAQYGRVEARMRVPAGGGLWPAFWMLGADFASKGWPDAGEIDVMENVGHEPGTVHGSLHGPGYSGADSLTGSYELPGGARLSDDFHTYAVDWSPGAVTFSLDGVPYSTKTSRDADAWAHDGGPAFLILNLAVGGTWGGEPDPETAFPAQLLVDRVAVYSAEEPR